MTLETASEVGDLKRRIVKLEKINRALMSRVERSVDSQFNAFSLFETAIALDHQVRRRTQELQQAMRSIEKAKRQAEAASSLKTTFVTSVGHDLMQPLNAARLALQMPQSNPQAMESAQGFMTRVAKIDVSLCPCCKVGRLQVTAVLQGQARLTTPACAVIPPNRGPP